MKVTALGADHQRKTIVPWPVPRNKVHIASKNVETLVQFNRPWNVILEKPAVPYILNAIGNLFFLTTVE